MQKIKPAVVFLVDGMRPDAIIQANVPNIKNLINHGAHSLSAQTVFPSVTLPCIMSIFHGVPPETHDTIGNIWNSQDWQAPGLFDLFHTAGKKTASFYNWEQLRDLSRPGSLDLSICLNNSEDYSLPLGESDSQLTRLALPFLSNAEFDLNFVYLGCVDSSGHKHGWMSPEYMQTLENADACIGQMLAVLPGNALVVIAADHGGHDTSHGSSDPVDMTVPLIFHGEGVPHGELANPVATLDIAPTVAGWGGLEIPPEWVGKNLL